MSYHHTITILFFEYSSFSCSFLSMFLILEPHKEGERVKEEKNWIKMPPPLTRVVRGFFFFDYLFLFFYFFFSFYILTQYDTKTSYNSQKILILDTLDCEVRKLKIVFFCMYRHSRLRAAKFFLNDTRSG